MKSVLEPFTRNCATLVFDQPGPARAQTNYPSRPIQLVVTVPPGGAADFVARLIGAKLADALGQPVVISNRGGAGGTTAAAAVAKSDPDGYTLLLNTIATHGIGPHLYAKPAIRPGEGFFSPIILLTKLPLIMTVNAELPAQSVQEVIALAKARPGELSVRLGRQRRRAASRRRTVQEPHRNRPAARSLPWQRPGGDRSRRWTRSR